MRLLASAALATLALAGCVQILGIGEDPKYLGEGGSGGASDTVSNTGVGGGGGELVGPCAQTDPQCTAVESDCVALVDNRDQDVFALRMMQAIVAKPDVFKADTPEGNVINNSIGLNLPECRLNNGGTISIIVELDRVNQQGRAGVAYPVNDPYDGYTFVDEVIDNNGTPFNVTPAIFTGSVDDNGVLSEARLESITMPLYLNQSGSEFILIPLRKGRLYDVTLSADQNCVGSYNAFGLDPNNGCLPDQDNGIYEFVNGGKADGYILLEEAEDIVVEAFNGFLNETLCARLANNDNKWVQTNVTPKRCKRNANDEIIFPGDWCSENNGPATIECNDAMYFNFSFAAAAVTLNDPPAN